MNYRSLAITKLLGMIVFTHTPKLSNQKTVFIEFSVLIGLFYSMSTKLIIKCFITVRPELIQPSIRKNNCDKIDITYSFVHFVPTGEIPNSMQYRIFINNWRGNKCTRRTQSLGTVNV